MIKVPLEEMDEKADAERTALAAKRAQIAHKKYNVPDFDNAEDPFAGLISKYSNKTSSNNVLIQNNIEDPFASLIAKHQNKQIQKPQSLFGLTPENIKSTEEQLGQGGWEQMRSIPQGIKEGLMEQVSALRGKAYKKGELLPSKYPEYAESGRSVGEFIGKTPALLGATAAGGAVGGLPGAMLGGAAAGFGTTPGNAFERVVGAAETGALPLISKIPGALRLAKKVVTAPFKNLKPLEENVESSALENKLAEEAEKSQKLKSQLETGKSNVYSAKGKAESELSQLPEKQPLYNLQATHEFEKKNLSDIENQLEKGLNKGVFHDVKIGESVNKKIQKIENHYSTSYKKLMDDLKDAKFEMPEIQTKQIDLDMEDILNQVRGMKGQIKLKVTNKKTNPYLDDLISIAPKSVDRSASEYLSKYKDFRSERYNLSQKLKTEQSSVERDKIKQALNKSKDLEDQLKTVLDEGLGPYAEEFKRINTGYSDLIFPLRSNRVSKYIREKGKSPKNMIEAITGESLYPRTAKGQKALRDIIESDPEIMRNVLGQKYASKINKINPEHELVKPYLEKIPELKDLLAKQKQSKIRLGEFKDQLKESKKTEENYTKRNKLQKEIEDYDKHISELDKLTKQKNISLEKKMNAEKQLEKAKKKRKLARGAMSLLIGAPLVNKYVKGASKVIEASKNEEE